MRACIAIVLRSVCLAMVGFCLRVRDYSANMYQVFMTIKGNIFALYWDFYSFCLHLSKSEIYDASHSTWG